MKYKTESTINVQITLSIPINDVWGDNCTIGQMRKQSQEAAFHKVAKLLEGANIKASNAIVNSIVHKNK